MIPDPTGSQIPNQPSRAKRGRVPYGWRNARTDKAVVRLPEPREADFVLEARRLRVEGQSFRKIARLLTAAGARNRAGERLRAMDVFRMCPSAIRHKP